MAQPKQIEIWTDLRIVVRNYEEEDIGECWSDVGIRIHSIDYDDNLEQSDFIYIEKEKIPELIRALQEFVD